MDGYDQFQQEETDAQIALQLQRDDEEVERHAALILDRECIVCGDALPMTDFPVLDGCTHDSETCLTCFQAWISSELNDKTWNALRCPANGCQVVLEYHDVQQYATRDGYERYDFLATRSALNDDPNFRWCRGPSCNSGQIHMNGVEGNIFRCVACGFRVCVIHEDTWHEGETCADYDYRVSGKKEQDQQLAEEATSQYLEGNEQIKKCPGAKCGWKIEKTHGCDHMTCARCRHEFCWQCLAPYSSIRANGNASHKKNCKYHTRNLGE
ncbi:hypothetical protein EJ04DRAFT_423048 [Polyplosphaeria fusca]|uniref:RBR-type E3 ubiquitin transferase n=1 Tax=Polyplosphaeria fusca TaxID=682080 RepID=A0A9P4R907_9PLEO|nr:hypothetical protein EJ04DRAFT_423048 [Polyplosphaeria fusca]